jgi:hypothetical protein
LGEGVPRPVELHLDLGGIHRAGGALLVAGAAEIVAGGTGAALFVGSGSSSATALAIMALAVATGCGLVAVAVVSARPAARARRHAAVVGGTGILLAYQGTYVALGWDAVERVTVHRPNGRTRPAVVVARLAEDSPAGSDPVLEPFRFPEQAVRMGLPDDDRTVFVGVLAHGAAGRDELRVLRGLAGGRLAREAC